jgi:hypothetical protein
MTRMAEMTVTHEVDLKVTDVIDSVVGRWVKTAGLGR